MHARLTRWITGISLTLVVSAIAPRLFSDSLNVRLEGGDLRLSAPNLPFLSGRVLERIRNGAVVYIDFHATLWTSPRTSPRRRSVTRVGVSYDLWEERFAVTHEGSPSHGVSHLTATAAEAWCLGRLTVPVSALAGHGRKGRFWIRLGYHIPEEEQAPGPNDGSGFTLRSLVDRLSRCGRPGEARDSLQVGPFTLEH